MISQAELQAASLHLADHSVGLVRIAADGRALFGSGTLINAGKCRSILTTVAVLDLLPKTGRLGVTLRTELNQISFDMSELIYRWLPVAPGQIESRLGLIELSEVASQRFDQWKRFVNLGDVSFAATSDVAFWCANGFTAKLTTTDLPLDCFDMVCGYTNLTGLQTSQINFVPAPKTILDVQLDLLSEQVESDELAGLVGCALWKVRFALDPSRARVQDTVLSGVVETVNATPEGLIRCAVSRWEHDQLGLVAPSSGTEQECLGTMELHDVRHDCCGGACGTQGIRASGIRTT